MRGSWLLSGLIVFGASLGIFIRQPTPRSVPNPREQAQAQARVQGGISMGLEWDTDPARVVEWRLLTEASEYDARARAVGGDWSWFETAAELADPFFVAPERRRCDVDYGSAIDGVCSYSFFYVAERVEEGTGKLVFVRGALRDRNAVPAAETANDEDCERYVGCLARARLGASIPIPSDWDAHEVVFHEHVQSHWGDPILFDLERLGKLIEFWTQDRNYLIELHARGEMTEVGDALRLRFIKSLVSYLHQHRERLQQKTGEGE